MPRTDVGILLISDHASDVGLLSAIAAVVNFLATETLPVVGEVVVFVGVGALVGVGLFVGVGEFLGVGVGLAVGVGVAVALGSGTLLDSPFVALTKTENCPVASG